MSFSSLFSAMVLLLVGMLLLVGPTHAFLPVATMSRARAVSSSLSRAHTSSALLLSNTRVDRTKLWADVAEKSEVTDRVITVSEAAITHLEELREKQGVDHLYLRMGVRSGGCSGMSYVLDMMKKEEVTEEDHIEAYQQHKFSCVVDPKSMLYLFGLKLDYKDALIGGGFQFYNPNSQEECGCGKSFGI